MDIEDWKYSVGFKQAAVIQTVLWWTISIN